MLKILLQNIFLPDGKFFFFDIEYIKGSQNAIPDFLTCEFLQCRNGK